MSLNVFVSGVSAEFRDQRIALATRLRKFRNLDLYPIVQEDLIEASSPSSSLIGKLAANIRQCPLVLCLIGQTSGYPETVAERLQCQRLSERILQEQYGRTVLGLGTLWNDWSALGYGMTYSQLEFFLAASVFASDTRTRVFLLDEAKDADDQQAPYVNFLKDRDQTLDWSPLTEADEDAVTLAVEFGLQHRDVRHRTSSADQSVSAAAAMTRGLVVLENVVKRGQQTNEHYDYFYENVIWPRMTQSVVALRQRSVSFQIRRDIRRTLFVSGGNPSDGIGNAVAFQSPAGTHVFRHGRDLSAQYSSTVFPHVTDSEQIRAIRPDGQMLLTHGQAGYQLHSPHGPIFDVFGGDVPNVFDRVMDSVAGTDGEPEFFIAEEHVHKRVHWNGSQFQTNQVRSIPARTTFVSLVHRPVEFSTRGNPTSLTSDKNIQLPMNARWSWLGNDVALVMLADERQFYFARFGLAPLGDLFLLKISDGFEGAVVGALVLTSRENQQLLEFDIAIGDNERRKMSVSWKCRDEDFSDTAELMHAHKITMSDPDIQVDQQVSTLESDAKLTSYTINVPSGTTHDLMAPVQANGKYAWSSNCKYLIYVTEAQGTHHGSTRSHIYIYRFPRSLHRQEAVDGVGTLWQLINGQLAIPAIGTSAPK